MATFLIVPGAFTPPAMFQDLCDFASDQGVAILTVKLATVGPHLHEPAPGIFADVESIRQVVEPLLDEGIEVILVASSLGGVAGTQSLEFLSLTARASCGKQNGIERIIYVSSLILEPNVSAVDFFGPETLPILKLPDEEKFVRWMDEVDDGSLTFSDLPVDQARKHKAKMTRFHSRQNFQDKLTYPGYKFAKVFYVLCEEDRIIPIEAQMAFVEVLRKYNPGSVTVLSILAGHLPFVTRIKDIFQILLDIARN